MHRLLLTALVLLLGRGKILAAAANPAAPAAARPNILFVIADQWRAQALGYAGDPNVRTPHLDSLAAGSVNFVNAVSGISVCCPARASILTGQRPLTHGVFMNDVSLNPEAASLAKVLKQAGYDTGYIGKWHVDGHGRSNFIPRERRQGFDYWKVLECTHSYNNSYYYADGPEKLKWDGFDAIAQTADARQYLRDHANTGKPFCLFLAWGPPHDPYQLAPEKYRALYDPAAIRLRPNVPVPMMARARTAQAGYYASCTTLDDGMGDLLQTLRETGQLENTVVVFTSDHGDLLGSHDAFNKQQPYDESIRVPLLFHWPKGLGTGARQLTAPFNSEDFMPTLLGLADLAIPPSVEGIDYSGYLRGGRNPSDGATVIAAVAPFGQWDRRAGGKEYRGIRTERYTYVRDLNGPWLLFDNQDDPYQMNNLAGKPGQAVLQAELEAVLTRKLKANGDAFLPAETYIRQWGYPVNEFGTVPYTN
jgi:arylsulfatase A-like enzyme